jgi:hypothetical protein
MPPHGAPAADREISAERTPADDAAGVEAADAVAAGGERVAAGGGDALEPAPTFEVPPEPVIEVEEDALAGADRSTGEIAAATTPADYLDAIAAAPPSVKAQAESTMEADLARLAEGEAREFEASVPDFEARMGGGEEIPPPVPVAPPGVTPEPLEANAPPAAVPADEGRLPAPEPYAANNRIVDLLTRVFGLGDSASVGSALSQVQTSDVVDTNPGPAPPVPLEGETDPRRVADQADAAGRQARNRRDEATDAVINGRGPEAVQARPLQETMPVPQLAQARFAGTAAAAEGAVAFRERSLDPDVVALFDAQHGPAMEASLSGARAELNTATQTRDSDRQAEVAAAEAETARLNEAADQGQNRQIIASRNDIQAARQTAVDDQARAVGDLEAAAGNERQLAQGRIHDHVTAENQRISERYNTAQQDAESDLREGERQATAKKAEARRDAENRSWWDRAVDWVADQFDRLARAINRVFDAVRARIKDLVDAAKQFAEAVIDAAADFVKGAIRRFGEFMKSAVNTLLGDTFPGIARALNAGIDSAVETAVAAVDAIAEGLKAGIHALLDALGKALDAILAVFQAAVNTVLAIARAAITGDWSAVARMILEPILRALGIEPQEFYAFFGRVADVIGKIIDEPGAFLQNLLDGVMGGFRRFGDNLLRHLQAGIIGWLTGALGGDITLPERWDLMGVLDLIRQILGLTLAMIRRVAVRILGEAAVEKIEFFIAFAVDLVNGGWRAFFDRIKDSLGNLKTMVLDQIKNFLVERIVMAAVSWLIGLFNPVGALIKIVMTIWNLILFLKDQLMRIIEVVRTVVGSDHRHRQPGPGAGDHRGRGGARQDAADRHRSAGPPAGTGQCGRPGARDYRQRAPGDRGCHRRPDPPRCRPISPAVGATARQAPRAPVTMRPVGAAGSWRRSRSGGAGSAIRSSSGPLPMMPRRCCVPRNSRWRPGSILSRPSIASRPCFKRRTRRPPMKRSGPYTMTCSRLSETPWAKKPSSKTRPTRPSVHRPSRPLPAPYRRSVRMRTPPGKAGSWRR